MKKHEFDWPSKDAILKQYTFIFEQESCDLFEREFALFHQPNGMHNEESIE